MMYQISEPYEDNLGHTIVLEEIEDALALYPEYSYQTIFAIPEFRQKLITYVITKISRPHRLVETDKALIIKQKLPYRSLELRLMIEGYVHEGIQTILQSEFELFSESLSFNQLADYDFPDFIKSLSLIRG